LNWLYVFAASSSKICFLFMVDSSSFESASSGKQTKHRETVVNVQ
jgi:hypothetical protein